jgi:hypothetical protein
MNPVKRLGVVAVLVVLGALCAASPALAGKPLPYTGSDRVWLVPPESYPPEPQASGKCIHDWVYWPGFYYAVDVTVTCIKLTPGEQYHVWWWGESDWGSYPVTADGKGKLSVQFGADDAVYVWVQNDTGAVVLQEEY